MIVYNVKRRFFALKCDADAYRKAEGLRPVAVTPLRIETREELAVLLTELCEPGATGPLSENVVPARVVDEAWIPPATDVPAFLRKEREAIWRRMEEAKR